MMNKKYSRLFSLLAALILTVCMAASAGAEAVTETILGTGTTQAFTDEAVPYANRWIPKL